MQLPFLPLAFIDARPDLLGTELMPPLTPGERINRIATRRRDIEQTKRGASYEYYIKHVPAEKRMLTPRIDPDKTSVRSWKGKLRAWRLSLHEYREFWEGEQDAKSEQAPSESVPDMDSEFSLDELADLRISTPSPPKPSWAAVVHALRATEAAPEEGS